MVLTETEFSSVYFHIQLLCERRIYFVQNLIKSFYSFGKLHNKQLCIRSCHVQLLITFICLLVHVCFRINIFKYMLSSKLFHFPFLFIFYLGCIDFFEVVCRKIVINFILV